MRLPSILATILICASTIPVAVAIACAAQQDTRTANEIFVLMVQAYRDCKSYADSGVVKTSFIMPNGRVRTVEEPFTTAFVRPDRFRFEFQDKSGGGDRSTRYIVWRQGAQVQTWWDVKPGVATQPSLQLALAGATGVSGGSAYTIPGLLLGDEMGGWRLTTLQDATRIEDASLDAVNCYRIQGKHGSELMTIWIDSTTFLVRRIDTGHVFENFRTEQITTYDAPAINSPVSDEKLAFDPPQK